MAALPWQMLVVVFYPQVWEKEQDGLWGHSPFPDISIKMLRMPSVPSPFPEKEELKKLLQAPSPSRYQPQVIKTHPLHLQTTSHTVQPWNGLSSAFGGRKDEKSAQELLPHFWERGTEKLLVWVPRHGAVALLEPLALPFTPALLSDSC